MDIQYEVARPRLGRLRRAPQPELLDVCPMYLTRPQAAAIAGTTTRTIDRWLRDPRVPLTLFRGGNDRYVQIAREELRVWMAISAAETLRTQMAIRAAETLREQLAILDATELAAARKPK